MFRSVDVTWSHSVGGRKEGPPLTRNTFKILPPKLTTPKINVTLVRYGFDGPKEKTFEILYGGS